MASVELPQTAPSEALEVEGGQSNVSDDNVLDEDLIPSEESLNGDVTTMSDETLRATVIALRGNFLATRKRLRLEELHVREHIRARQEMERVLLQSGQVLPMPKRGVILSFLLPQNLNSAPDGFVFKTSDCPGFPHRVRINQKTGKRELFIESRVHVYIRCRLHTLKNVTRTEYDLDPTGSVQFKLTWHFANTMQEVRTTDLKDPPETLLLPSESQVGVMRMANGLVEFQPFRMRFTSDNTIPRQQSFVARVQPVDPVLRADPDLTAVSPPIKIAARSDPKK